MQNGILAVLNNISIQRWFTFLGRMADDDVWTFKADYSYY